eukprot:m.167185 g.167185  ORF g.167185 m.167185 type:complete len:50 (+) comp16450_c2_seq1:2757-2906(+)
MATDAAFMESLEMDRLATDTAPGCWAEQRLTTDPTCRSISHLCDMLLLC